jgi:Fic family protein
VKPYEPTSLPLPTETLDLRRLITPAGAANAELGRYDGLLQGIVNPAIMLSPLTVEEAVLSSRLEGTQATVDDVYEHEAGIEKDAEKKHDVQEVINYRTALRLAQEHLQEYPITLSFVLGLHKLLLSSVRGKDKSPGSFREVQNWIGFQGTPIEDAFFIPPSPLRLQDHMENWLNYLETEDIDVLLQAAVMHAQFEMLHPFKDGNGRIGRLLIPLFLYQKKRLSQPMFYLSAYLERHRDEYYGHLGAISQKGDWNGWILFFLQAITEQAKSNIEKVNHIRELYEQMKQKIQEITHSQYSVHVLDQIFNRPMFKTTDFVKEIGIQKATAMSILRQLKKGGILNEFRPGCGRRPAILAFPDLLNVAEGKKVL